MDSLHREELVRLMANKVDGLSQRLAGAALSAALESITETLVQGGIVRLNEFGTFTVRKRSARRIQHPRTRETLEVAACTIPTFVPAAALRSRVSRSGV
jgi:nucleoid DNA-binding protein